MLNGARAKPRCRKASTSACRGVDCLRSLRVLRKPRSRGSRTIVCVLHTLDAVTNSDFFHVGLSYQGPLSHSIIQGAKPPIVALLVSLAGWDGFGRPNWGLHFSTDKGWCIHHICATCTTTTTTPPSFWISRLGSGCVDCAVDLAEGRAVRVLGVQVCGR